MLLKSLFSEAVPEFFLELWLMPSVGPAGPGSHPEDPEFDSPEKVKKHKFPHPELHE